MYQAVRENLRGLPVELAEPRGYNAELVTNVAGSLTEELTRIADETDLGFKMVFDPREPKHVFTVYRGVDRTWGSAEPVVFSEEMKNLFNLRVINDDSLFFNVAYVAVENRQTGAVSITTVGSAEGLERHELYLQFTPRDDMPDPAAFGRNELTKHLLLKTFIAEVNPKDWQVKYNLGDLVTCKSTWYGLRFDTRIMHFKEVTENNKRVVTLTLGEPDYYETE
jgi:hypothetical protein